MVDPDPDGDSNDEVAGGVLTALDTSFLIPAPSSGKPFLPVSTKGKGGALLDEAKFATLHDKAEYNSTAGGPGGISGDRKAVYDATSVVGFRYDPCAPEAFHGEVPVAAAECRHELRLVAQPSAGGGRFGDAALHLVYQLTPDESAKVRDRLRAIKKACGKKTEGAPVGPHPCLVGSKAKKFFDDNVGPLILEFAGDANLRGTAVMVTAQGDAGIEWHWRLAPNAPPPIGYIVAPKLPNTGDSEFGGFRADGSYMQDPTSEISDGKTGLVRTSAIQSITPGGAADRPLADIGDGLVAAYAAENPRLSSLPGGEFFQALLSGAAPPAKVGGVECMSCHVQSPALTVLEEAGLIDRIRDENPALHARIQAAAFKPLDKIAADHLPATRDLHVNTLIDGNYVVINFGFLFDTPSVNRRVQHEAEDVAQYIVEVLDKKK